LAAADGCGQREVWTGAELRRLLAEISGLEISALLTKEPSQIERATLIALCTALECTPNDLFEVDTTPPEQPATPSRPVPTETKETANARGRSMPL